MHDEKQEHEPYGDEEFAPAPQHTPPPGSPPSRAVLHDGNAHPYASSTAPYASATATGPPAR
jgi:hypothetical protein